ncbi:hypothetical protein WJ84_00980 [Burkholderia ubonensis]|nr:hypothetical protein WJ84_00980 [Burkholderia ubonensis]
MGDVDEFPWAVPATARDAFVQMLSRFQYASDAYAAAPWTTRNLKQLPDIQPVRAEADADPTANQFMGFALVHGKLLLVLFCAAYHF